MYSDAFVSDYRGQPAQRAHGLIDPNCGCNLPKNELAETTTCSNMDSQSCVMKDGKIGRKTAFSDRQKLRR